MTEDKVINIVLDELKRRNLIHKTNDPYKTTKQVLFRCNDLKESIKDNVSEMKDLQKYGPPQKSGSITMIVQGGTKEDDATKIEARINNLKQVNHITNCFLTRINKMILKENKEIQNVLDLFFNKNMKQEEIADQFSDNPKLNEQYKISRVVNDFINKIMIILFPNNFINELGY